MNEWPSQIKCNEVPWNDKLLKVDKDSPLISIEEAELFHSFSMKGIVLVKIAHPDEQPGIGFLRSRIKAPTKQDKIKLINTLQYIFL